MSWYLFLLSAHATIAVKCADCVGLNRALVSLSIAHHEVKTPTDAYENATTLKTVEAEAKPLLEKLPELTRSTRDLVVEVLVHAAAIDPTYFLARDIFEPVKRFAPMIKTSIDSLLHDRRIAQDDVDVFWVGHAMVENGASF